MPRWRMKSDDKIMIGERLARLRRAQGYTQRELGERADISWRTYQAYESGFREIPASALMRLCDHLHWNAAWILTGKGPLLLHDDRALLRSNILRVEEKLEKLGVSLSNEKKADLICLVIERDRLSEAMPDRELENCIAMGIEK